MTLQCHPAIKFGSFSQADLDLINTLVAKQIVTFEWEQPADKTPCEQPKEAFDPRCFEYSNLAAFPFAAQPRGLINRGNTCFMNAILQPLLHLRPFFGLFHEFAKYFPADLSHGYGLIEAFIELTGSSVQTKPIQVHNGLNTTQILSPDALYDAMKRKGSILKAVGAQEDAHEFFCHLIDGLHEEFLQHISHNPTLYYRPQPAEPEEGWKKILSKRDRPPSIQRHASAGKETPISGIFSGCTRSSIKYSTYNGNFPNSKESVTIEPFFCLQLDIQHHKDPEAKPNLLSSLKAHSSPENVQYSPGEENYDASKSITFESLPQCLCINFKTFAYSYNTGDILKLDKFIPYPAYFTFPSESMHRHQDYPEIEAPSYKLISVVYHHGKGASGGHYTSDVLVATDSGKSVWMRFDDEVVLGEVSEAEVLREKPHQSAYILFYQRLDPGQEVSGAEGAEGGSLWTTAKASKGRPKGFLESRGDGWI